MGGGREPITLELLRLVRSLPPCTCRCTCLCTACLTSASACGGGPGRGRLRFAKKSGKDILRGTDVNFTTPHFPARAYRHWRCGSFGIGLAAAARRSRSGANKSSGSSQVVHLAVYERRAEPYRYVRSQTRQRIRNRIQ